jgi:glycine/D-amino acid oxidase-like deaminating enzyme
MHYHQIIVGQGIAGSLLAYQLLKLNQQVLVIDNGNPNSSSRIAAGMYTPISGKRMVKSWMVDTLYPVLISIYKELEKTLGTRFLNDINIQLSFASIKEQNDFYSALNDKINHYVQTEITPHSGLNAPFGAVEITHSGWLNTIVFLDTFKQHLQRQNSFVQEDFDYDALTYHNNQWHYKNHSANTVVFCQGYHNKHNPFFKHIPLIDNKGDVFKIKTTALNQHKIYKRGAYAVNLYDNVFKVGSTYKWDNDDTTPTPEGYAELNEKTAVLIKGDYKVLEHFVGIRPTTKDRRPILGKHTEQPAMFMFNGLGTKGVLLAPYFSKIMADFILNDTAIDKEISTNRF